MYAGSEKCPEDDEEPFYEETERELVTTTRSGRKVYRPRQLIVTLPGNVHNEEDIKELEQHDQDYGSDDEGGLSERSIDESEESDDTGMATSEDESEEEDSDFLAPMNDE